MLRRFAIPAILVFSILVASLGITRLKFDTDILSSLPAHLPEVKGLKAYEHAFSHSDELVLLLEGKEGDEGKLSLAAESLGKFLQQENLAKSTRWKPGWMDDTRGLSELVAYLWLNGKEAPVDVLVQKLSAAKSKDTITGALRQTGTAMEGMDMVMRAHDPFGFLQHPALSALTSNSTDSNGFESANSRSHLLFVYSPQLIDGYKSADSWLQSVRKSIAKWQTKEGHEIQVHLTGEPAFTAEIGRAMEYDLSGSIGLTLGLIGLLFWWMQRRLSLLLGLVGILIIVIAVALGLAGWFYGKLSIVALSSAEILIGLAVDYGLVICQEAKVAGHNKRALQLASARPILCGALTTALVFSALNFGSFSGMAQLGTIVGMGLAVAAILMLSFYLPFVVKFGSERKTNHGQAKILPRQRLSRILTACLAAVAIVTLCVCGIPGMDLDSKIMHPLTGEAAPTLEKIQSMFSLLQKQSLNVVIEANTDDEMLQRIEAANQRLQSAQCNQLISQSLLPSGWWPDIASQNRNRDKLKALASDKDRLLSEASDAGFSEEGTSLGKAVLKEISMQTTAEALVFPKSDSAKDILRLFLARQENGGGCLLGTLQPAAGIEPAGKDYAAFRQLTGNGIWLSSWELFKPAISNILHTDMLKILIPMSVFLLGMLYFIFRRYDDVLLCVYAIAFCSLLLLAIMSVSGLTWNFINLLAIPLILGTGIDYSIHVTLTMRRAGGNFAEFWNGTGKALVFCGCSNVIGFGSLCYSSTKAMITLGTVSVIGIILSMLVSIFLLPGWKKIA